MDTPKLRFNGLENPWRNILFNEMFDYLRNNTFSRDCLNYQNGNFKNIHYGDILTKFAAIVNVCQTNVPFINTYISFKVDKQKLLQDGDIVFADTAEDEAVGRCIEISGAEKTKTVSGLHTIPVRPKMVFAPSFLGYDLNSNEFHNRLKPLMQGIKVISLNRTALEKIKVEYPEDIEEQRRISLFFCDFDQEINTKVTEIETLCHVKTAAMVSMFPQKGEDAPRMRFKGFDGPWTASKLGELSEKVLDKNSQLDFQTTFTNSAELEIIDQLDFFDHSISRNANIGHYTIVREDDFVYNPRISVTAPVGPINRNKLGYAGVVSPLYYVFRVYDINKDFLEFYFKTSLWHKYLKDNGNTGARHDRISITDDLFRQMPIFHPQSLAEQQKIAEFFQNLERQIECQTQILERLKRVKASCLDQMFV